MEESEFTPHIPASAEVLTRELVDHLDGYLAFSLYYQRLREDLQERFTAEDIVESTSLTGDHEYVMQSHDREKRRMGKYCSILEKILTHYQQPLTLGESIDALCETAMSEKFEAIESTCLFVDCTEYASDVIEHVLQDRLGEVILDDDGDTDRNILEMIEREIERAVETELLRGYDAEFLESLYEKLWTVDLRQELTDENINDLLTVPDRLTTMFGNLFKELGVDPGDTIPVMTNEEYLVVILKKLKEESATQPLTLLDRERTEEMVRRIVPMELQATVRGLVITQLWQCAKEIVTEAAELHEPNIHRDGLVRHALWSYFDKEQQQR